MYVYEKACPMSSEYIMYWKAYVEVYVTSSVCERLRAWEGIS